MAGGEADDQPSVKVQLEPDDTLQAIQAASAELASWRPGILAELPPTVVEWVTKLKPKAYKAVAKRCNKPVTDNPTAADRIDVVLQACRENPIFDKCTDEQMESLVKRNQWLSEISTNSEKVLCCSTCYSARTFEWAKLVVLKHMATNKDSDVEKDMADDDDDAKMRAVNLLDDALTSIELCSEFDVQLHEVSELHDRKVAEKERDVKVKLEQDQEQKLKMQREMSKPEAGDFVYPNLMAMHASVQASSSAMIRTCECLAQSQLNLKNQLTASNARVQALNAEAQKIKDLVTGLNQIIQSLIKLVPK